jgi:hypothetical protein
MFDIGKTPENAIRYDLVTLVYHLQIQNFYWIACASIAFRLQGNISDEECRDVVVQAKYTDSEINERIHNIRMGATLEK